MNQYSSQALLYLADISAFLKRLIDNQGAPVDYEVLVVLFLIFAVLLISVTLGRTKMMISLFSIYIAAFLQAKFLYFDYLDKIFKDIPVAYVDIGFFAILYAAVFIVLSRILKNSRITARDSSLLTVIPIALLQSGFLASILVSYIPDTAGGEFASTIQTYFGSKTAQFWWAVIPLVALFFMKLEKKRG